MILSLLSLLKPRDQWGDCISPDCDFGSILEFRVPSDSILFRSMALNRFTVNESNKYSIFKARIWVLHWIERRCLPVLFTYVLKFYIIFNPMAARSTTLALKRLRDVMKNTSYVSQCLQAYIIPSCDAHQVRNWNEFKFIFQEQTSRTLL